MHKKRSDCFYGSSRRELSTAVAHEAKPLKPLDSKGVPMVIRQGYPGRVSGLVVGRLHRKCG